MQRSPLEYLVHGVTRPVQRQPGEPQVTRLDGTHLATALGTLILAVATFSAVRSSNLMARIAQEQFLVQLRPVLTTSRREDPTLKVNFGDTKWVHIPGGGAVGEIGPGEGSMGPDTSVVYLAIALRNDPAVPLVLSHPVHHNWVSTEVRSHTSRDIAGRVTGAGAVASGAASPSWRRRGGLAREQ
jgi:hypothetical protein